MTAMTIFEKVFVEIASNSGRTASSGVINDDATKLATVAPIE